uniref:Uncharacterized protein n=1 Tax=Ackermannviridae sp. TaxID=2831612 RepID=A0A8S5VPZ1_9CAUD|nr:MAG TPA: hypothetical protein [Ackermannviridae sp.]
MPLIRRCGGTFPHGGRLGNYDRRSVYPKG